MGSNPFFASPPPGGPQPAAANETDASNPFMAANMGAAPAQANPSTRLAGVQATPPQQGADALTHGPALGIHPDTALPIAPEIKPVAELQARQATVANSPSLTSWFHSASNAAVAAVQDELPSLASIGDLFSGRLPRRSPLTEPTYAAWDSLVQAYDHSQQALARGRHSRGREREREAGAGGRAVGVEPHRWDLQRGCGPVGAGLCAEWGEWESVRGRDSLYQPPLRTTHPHTDDHDG